jgi:hypothetical protein
MVRAPTLSVAWTSGNGRAILRLQEDRNLVLYKDNQAAFQAPNAWSRDNTAIMQDDGNFVLYDQNNEPLWSANTAGNPGAHLAIQDDGNMVVYQDSSPLFATNTGDWPPPASIVPSDISVRNSAFAVSGCGGVLRAERSWFRGQRTRLPVRRSARGCGARWDRMTVSLAAPSSTPAP